VVADLPFGSYQAGPQQAFETSVRFMKEGGAHAVKLEGGVAMVPQVELLVSAGIPVMAHLGFTPQSEHALDGYRIQGRDDEGTRIVEDALALQEAGAFAVVLKMVPADVAKRVTAGADRADDRRRRRPGVRRAGAGLDRHGRAEPRPRAEVRQALCRPRRRARRRGRAVRRGRAGRVYPDEEHSYN